MTPSGRSLTDQTVAGFLWMIYGKGAYAILQVVVLAVLARLVTPADFGVMSAALIVVGLSAIVSQLGVGPALVQRRELEQRHIDTAFATSVGLGILLGGLIWLAAPAAAEFFRIERVTPVLRTLALLFPLQGMATVAESLVKRDLRFRWLANLDVISYGLGYGAVAVAYGAVGITLALLGQGVWALVLGHIAQTVVKTAVLLSHHPPRIRSMPDARAFKELMYFGGGFTVAKIANQLAQEGDELVVARFLGQEPLGIYGRAYQLMSAPASGLATMLDAVLFPAMARVQTERHRLAAAYRRSVALIALVVLPTSAIFVLLAPEVVHLVLGPRWTAAIVPFQILSLGMLFRSSSKIADSLTRATGAVYRRAWRQALYAALVMAGAWIGQHWGLAGVAWAVLLALTVNFSLMVQLSLRETGMNWLNFWRAHLPAMLVTAVLSPLGWAAVTTLRHWGMAPLAVAAAGGGVVLASALLLVLFAPGTFLGSDGQWMLGTMRSLVEKLIRRSPRPAGTFP